MDQGVERNEKKHDENREEKRGAEERIEKRWEEHIGSSCKEPSALPVLE